MNSIDIGHLVYLIVLGLMVLGWFVASNRNSLNKTAQQAAIWGLIILGTIAAIGLWDDIRRAALPYQATQSADGAVSVQRSRDGHYYLTLQINDAPVRFVVDTGATDIVLTQSDATRAGINVSALDYIGTANTANGTVPIAPVRLDRVALGPITDTRVRAVVNGGDMHGSLLGMGYLQRFGTISIADNTLTLSR